MPQARLMRFVSNTRAPRASDFRPSPLPERNLFGLYVRGRQQIVICPRGNQTNTLLDEGWHLVQARCLKRTVDRGEEWLREAEARYRANQSIDRPPCRQFGQMGLPMAKLPAWTSPPTSRD